MSSYQIWQKISSQVSECKPILNRCFLNHLSKSLSLNFNHTKENRHELDQTNSSVSISNFVQIDWQICEKMSTDVSAFSHSSDLEDEINDPVEYSFRVKLFKDTCLRWLSGWMSVNLGCPGWCVVGGRGSGRWTGSLGACVMSACPVSHFQGHWATHPHAHFCCCCVFPSYISGVHHF